MGEGGLEKELSFGNICTKWLISESFTTEIAAHVPSEIEELRDGMLGNYAPQIKAGRHQRERA